MEGLAAAAKTQNITLTKKLNAQKIISNFNTQKYP